MTLTVVAAGLCAAAAVWSLLLPGRSVLRLRRVLGSADGSHETAHQPGSASAGGSPLDPARELARRLGAAVTSWRAGRRQEARWRIAVIALCDGVGAELAAGRAQEPALAEAIAALEPEPAAVLRAEWAGGAGVGPSGVPPAGLEIPEMLERVARLPGAQGLRPLAACWRIGAERGGTFASVVDGLAAALRDEEAHREEIAAQLAGPRATARLLAGLPVLGLAMGAALGAHPLSFLFGTLPGVICLVLGGGLDALGLWWTRRLVAAAEAAR
ncbi:type II secretion system F family protein [Actinomadura scrupuli]|uniref:type II secretion system F family protein n=1 Tax=Actinomadura scrupuli TaxID=559629 RepID=UPI003D961BCA